MSLLLLFGGSSAATYSYTGSGGAQTGGAAVVSKDKVFAASGGAQTGGEAAVSRSKVFAASGGAQTSGAAVVSKSKVFAASGGPQSGGAALTSFEGTLTYTYVGSGGAQTGGYAAYYGFVPGVVAKGGDWNRMWRPPQPPRHYTGTGGISLGGAAVVQFIPAKVQPLPAVSPPTRTAIVYAFAAAGGAHLGGAATTRHHDHRKYVQRIDELDLGIAA